MVQAPQVTRLWRTGDAVINPVVGWPRRGMGPDVSILGPLGRARIVV